MTKARKERSLEPISVLIATGCVNKAKSKRRLRHNNPKMLGAEAVYLAKPPHEFQAALRLSRQVFDFVLTEIRPQIESYQRCVTLRFVTANYDHL